MSFRLRALDTLNQLSCVGSNNSGFRKYSSSHALRSNSAFREKFANQKGKSKKKETSKSSGDLDSSERTGWWRSFWAGEKTPLPPQAYLPQLLSALSALGVARYSDMPTRVPSGLIFSAHDPEARYLYGTSYDIYKPGGRLPEIEGVGRFLPLFRASSYEPGDYPYLPGSDNSLGVLEVAHPSTAYNVSSNEEAVRFIRKKLEEAKEYDPRPVLVNYFAHGSPASIGGRHTRHFAEDFENVFRDVSRPNLSALMLPACYGGTCYNPDLADLSKVNPDAAERLARKAGSSLYFHNPIEHPLAYLAKEKGFPIYTVRAHSSASPVSLVLPDSPPQKTAIFPFPLEDKESLRQFFGPHLNRELFDKLGNRYAISMGLPLASVYEHRGAPLLRVFSSSGEKVYHTPQQATDALSRLFGSDSYREAFQANQYPMLMTLYYPNTISDLRDGGVHGFLGMLANDPESNPWYARNKLGQFTHTYHPYFSGSAFVVSPLLASMFKSPSSRVWSSSLASLALSLPSLYSLAVQSAAFIPKAMVNAQFSPTAGTTASIASSALRELGPLAFFAIAPSLANTLMLYLSGDLQKYQKMVQQQSQKPQTESEDQESSEGRKDRSDKQDTSAQRRTSSDRPSRKSNRSG